MPKRIQTGNGRDAVAMETEFQFKSTNTASFLASDSWYSYMILADDQ